MRLGEALNLAKRSMPDFEKKIKDLQLSQLYQLVEDLQYVNRPEIFRPACMLLKKQLLAWYEDMKSSESEYGKADFKDVSRNFNGIRIFTFERTGFEAFNPSNPKIDLTKLPSEIFKPFVQKASSWRYKADESC
jgi:hypothetical protein